MNTLQLISKLAEPSVKLAIDELAAQNSLLTEYLQGRGVVSAEFDASTCRIADPYPKGLQKPTLEATYNEGKRVDSETVPITEENSTVPNEDVLAAHATPLDHKLVQYLVYAARISGVLQVIKKGMREVLIVDRLKELKQLKSTTGRHTYDKYAEVCDKMFELRFITIDRMCFDYTREIILDEFLDQIEGQDYGNNMELAVQAGIQQYRVGILQTSIPARLRDAHNSITYWITHGEPLIAQFIEEVGTYLYGPMPGPSRVITHEDDQKAVQAEEAAEVARREAKRQQEMPGCGYEWMRYYAEGGK